MCSHRISGQFFDSLLQREVDTGLVSWGDEKTRQSTDTHDENRKQRCPTDGKAPRWHWD